MRHTQQQKVNVIIGAIQNSTIANKVEDPEEYLSMISEIICEFDTDIAIKVLEGLNVHKEIAREKALAIKINYGY
jgi:hypothetical protein